MITAALMLPRAKLQWLDNATTRLDPATLLEFVGNLKVQTILLGFTSTIAIFQCSREALDLKSESITFFLIVAEE